MRSLRTKLTLALVAMSFIAIAVVGVTSRWLMLRRVDVLVTERALQGFVQHAAAYYEAYGSWSKARASEPYLAFQQRVYGVPLRPPPRGETVTAGVATVPEREEIAESAPESTRPVVEEDVRQPSMSGAPPPPRSSPDMNAPAEARPMRPPRMGAPMGQRPAGAGMRPPPGMGMRHPPPRGGPGRPPMGPGMAPPPAAGELDSPAIAEAGNPPWTTDDPNGAEAPAEEATNPSSQPGEAEAYDSAPEEFMDPAPTDEDTSSSPPEETVRQVRRVDQSMPMPGPLLGEDNGGPPVPVVITNLTGTVVVPLAGMQVGDEVRHEDYLHARPILAGGKRVGLAVPLKRPTRTALEQQYLSAIRDSWLSSLLLAAVLAIPLGLLLGSRFATPIVELTGAMGRMSRGILRQSVPVRGDDEIGQLSASFNQMSDDLANTYNELKASREQLSEQAEMLKELSRRDELTGLLNRRAFDEQAAQMFEQARRFDHPLTVAMIDIDHFKRVNDDYSHAVGDAVLREAAHLIGAKVREIDLVARYGGEEFALAFPETPLDAAGRFLDKLRQQMAAHDWEKVAPGLRLTLSAGLSSRVVGTTLEGVLDLADVRLHEAKTNGRNLVCY